MKNEMTICTSAFQELPLEKEGMVLRKFGKSVLLFLDLGLLQSGSYLLDQSQAYPRGHKHFRDNIAGLLLPGSVY